MAFGALCGLEIISYLTRQASPATSREISIATGVQRDTVYRTLNDLVGAGWLVAEGTPRRFAPSWNVTGLGLNMLARNRVRDIALRSVIDLASETGVTAILSFMDGSDTVMTDHVEVLGGRTILGSANRRVAAVISSAGRSILSRLPDSETERLIALGVPRLIERAPGGPDHVRREVQSGRLSGFAVCDGEAQLDSVSISAPVLDDSGRPVAAVGVSVLQPRVKVEGSFADPVRQWARRASIELGYSTVQPSA